MSLFRSTGHVYFYEEFQEWDFTFHSNSYCCMINLEHWLVLFFVHSFFRIRPSSWAKRSYVNLKTILFARTLDLRIWNLIYNASCPWKVFRSTLASAVLMCKLKFISFRLKCFDRILYRLYHCIKCLYYYHIECDWLGSCWSIVNIFGLKNICFWHWK